MGERVTHVEFRVYDDGPARKYWALGSMRQIVDLCCVARLEMIFSAKPKRGNGRRTSPAMSTWCPLRASIERIILTFAKHP